MVAISAFLLAVLMTWWTYASLTESKRANRLAELAYIEAYRDDCRAQNETGRMDDGCVQALTHSLPRPPWLIPLGKRWLVEQTRGRTNAFPKRAVLILSMDITLLLILIVAIRKALRVRHAVSRSEGESVSLTGSITTPNECWVPLSVPRLQTVGTSILQSSMQSANSSAVAQSVQHDSENSQPRRRIKRHFEALEEITRDPSSASSALPQNLDEVLFLAHEAVAFDNARSWGSATRLYEGVIKHLSSVSTDFSMLPIVQDQFGAISERYRKRLSKVEPLRWLEEPTDAVVNVEPYQAPIWAALMDDDLDVNLQDSFELVWPMPTVEFPSWHDMSDTSKHEEVGNVRSSMSLNAAKPERNMSSVMEIKPCEKSADDYLMPPSSGLDASLPWMHSFDVETSSSDEVKYYCELKGCINERGERTSVGRKVDLENHVLSTHGPSGSENSHDHKVKKRKALTTEGEASPAVESLPRVQKVQSVRSEAEARPSDDDFTKGLLPSKTFDNTRDESGDGKREPSWFTRQMKKLTRRENKASRGPTPPSLLVISPEDE